MKIRSMLTGELVEVEDEDEAEAKTPDAEEQEPEEEDDGDDAALEEAVAEAKRERELRHAAELSLAKEIAERERINADYLVASEKLNKVQQELNAERAAHMKTTGTIAELSQRIAAIRIPTPAPAPEKNGRWKIRVTGRDGNAQAQELILVRDGA